MGYLIAFLFLIIVILIITVVFLYKNYKTNESEFKIKESDLKTKELQSNSQLEYETNRAKNFETIVSNHASPYFQGRVSDIEMQNGNPFTNNILAKKGEDLGYLNKTEWQNMITNNRPGYISATTFKYNPFNQQLVHNESNTCVEASIADLTGKLKTCDNNNLQRWRLTDKHLRTIQDPNICLLATGKLQACGEANTQLSIEPYDANWGDFTKRKYV